MRYQQVIQQDRLTIYRAEDKSHYRLIVEGVAKKDTSHVFQPSELHLLMAYMAGWNGTSSSPLIDLDTNTEKAA